MATELGKTMCNYFVAKKLNDNVLFRLSMIVFSTVAGAIGAYGQFTGIGTVGVGKY